MIILIGQGRGRSKRQERTELELELGRSKSLPFLKTNPEKEQSRIKVGEPILGEVGQDNRQTRQIRGWRRNGVSNGIPVVSRQW